MIQSWLRLGVALMPNIRFRTAFEISEIYAELMI